ncbi:MAG TPA: PAS domain S-box protein [Polyangiaceae bacterium]
MRANRRAPVPADGSDFPVSGRSSRKVHAGDSLLPDAELQLNAVLRLAPLLVFAIDAEGTFTDVSGVGLERLGLHPAEVVGGAVHELFAPFPDVLDDVAQALAGSEVSATRKLGELWFDIRYTPLHDRRGRCVGTLGVATDVTESHLFEQVLASDHASRRLAEERLARSEAGFRALIECSADAIAVQTDGRVTYVNGTMIAYLGCSDPTQLLGASVLELFRPSERTLLVTRLDQVQSSGEPPAVMEYALCRRDGSEVTAQVAMARVPFGGQPSILITARDVTERRRMQAQLRAADRMATVGTLTASIAHEINNPLAALVGNLELLDARVCTGEPIDSADREALRDAREAAARIRHIVRELRNFTHLNDEKRAPLDVSHVLDSALKLAVNELKNRATVIKDYRIIPLVDANDVRLGQVFLNLIVNAAQAFPEPRPERNQIRIRTRNAGPHVMVEISDNGSGIAPAVIERIFDPLFTTKPIGVGSGLGLSICKGIIGALGGSITVKSELGRGTTFSVTLPASSAREMQPHSVWPSFVIRGALRVLVVDDEPMIRRILRRAFEAQHQVSVTSSARDALETIASGAKFDVVFCDLMMPEMTGMEFHERLCAMAPRMAERVVFMSGGVFTSEGRAFLDRFSDRHLAKPFELRQAQAMLERHASRSKGATSEFPGPAPL